MLNTVAMSLDEKYNGGLWIAKGNRWLGLVPPEDYEWQPLADRDFVAGTATPKSQDIRQEWYPYDCLEWMKAADQHPDMAGWGEFTIAIGDYDDGGLSLRNIEKFTVWRSDSMRKFTWWQPIAGQNGEAAGNEKIAVFPIFSIDDAGNYVVDERARSELILTPLGSQVIAYEGELKSFRRGAEGLADIYKRT